MRTEVRALLRLAWPVVLGTLGFRMLSVVALVVLGDLGDVALAAIGAASTYSISLLIVAIGVLQGFDPLFSQAHGAGDSEALGATLARATLLSALMGLPLIAAHLYAGPALLALGQPAEIVPAAAAWCRAMAVGVIPSLCFFAFRGFLIGQGQTMVPTVAMVVANAVNLAGHLWLVRAPGLTVERALSLSGACSAAVDTVLAVTLVVLAPGPFRAGFRQAARAFDAAEQRAMVALGLPAGLQLGLEVWAFNLSTLLVGRLGTTVLAGHTVALNLASVAFMVPLGLGVAASVRVGNQIGAGLPWLPAAKTALGMGVGWAVLSGALFGLFPAELARVYGSDAATVAVAAAALPFTAFFQIFDCTQAVSFGILRGAGDMRVPALANLFGYWVVGLPVGYALAFHTDMGFTGVWAGLTVGLALVALVLVLRIAQTARRPIERTRIEGRSATVGA